MPASVPMTRGGRGLLSHAWHPHFRLKTLDCDRKGQARRNQPWRKTGSFSQVTCRVEETAKNSGVFSPSLFPAVLSEYILCYWSWDVNKSPSFPTGGEPAGLTGRGRSPCFTSLLKCPHEKLSSPSHPTACNCAHHIRSVAWFFFLNNESTMQMSL